MRLMLICALATTLGYAASSGLGCSPAQAQTPGMPLTDWPGITDWPGNLHQRLNHEGVGGTLVLGGGDFTAATQEAFTAALPTGTAVVILPLTENAADESVEAVAQWLRTAGIQTVTIAELFGSGNSPDALQEIVDQLRAAGGVWICGDHSLRRVEGAAGSAVEAELQALLARGGVVGSDSAANSLAGVMLAPEADAGSEKLAQPNRLTSTTAGLDLVPDAIVDAPFTPKHSRRLRAAVTQHPDRFGLGIEAAATAVIQGRGLKVVGEGSAAVVLGKSSRQPEVVQRIPAGARIDLTQLRRAARWRAADIDPGQPCFGPPNVSGGSLVIVGGGGMPQEVIDRFLSLAGGKTARIVVLPTAVPRQEAFRARIPGFLARAEVASVTLLPHSRTEEIADEAFERALESATGVWFDGGRQWNFVDAYENTRAIELFHAVLQRGGVIGGSSAGATIQGEYLVRGHPLGNTVMMAEGYERGFAFLPGVAIDQHFSQRNRQRDLLSVIQRHRRLLGIGIDEATALVVSGSRGEVIGKHSVHFLRHPSAAAAPEGAHVQPAGAASPQASPRLQETDYLSVAAGQIIDLQTLKPLSPPTPEESPTQDQPAAE